MHNSPRTPLSLVSHTVDLPSFSFLSHGNSSCIMTSSSSAANSDEHISRERERTIFQLSGIHEYLNFILYIVHVQLLSYAVWEVHVCL